MAVKQQEARPCVYEDKSQSSEPVKDMDPMDVDRTQVEKDTLSDQPMDDADSKPDGPWDKHWRGN